MLIIELKEYKNGKVRVRTENGITFLLYRKEVARFRLNENSDVDKETWEQIRQDVLIKRARKRVMYLLQKKDYTEKQLREKLSGDEYPSDIAEDAIAYVKSFHYVDDGRYAASYIHYHQQDKSIMQMKMDLQQRGVSKEQIENALEEELQVSQDEIILKYLRKKQYDSEQADDGEKRRTYQFLMRKGFKSSDILRCMNLNEFA